jgi:hypothetical protein
MDIFVSSIYPVGTTMYALALALVVLGYFLVIPVIKYFLDPKGLRKYPNFYLLSGISDIPFIYEAHKSFRSRNLFEAYKKHPVLRVGPNSLSYSDPNAILPRTNSPHCFFGTPI